MPLPVSRAVVFGHSQHFISVPRLWRLGFGTPSPSVSRAVVFGHSQQFISVPCHWRLGCLWASPSVSRAVVFGHSQHSISVPRHWRLGYLWASPSVSRAVVFGHSQHWSVHFGPVVPPLHTVTPPAHFGGCSLGTPLLCASRVLLLRTLYRATCTVHAPASPSRPLVYSRRPRLPR